MAEPPRERASAQPKEPQAERASVSEPPAGQTEEWVFTLDSSTGEIVRVERIDTPSGQRQELSDEEYAALSGYGDPAAAYYTAEGYDTSAAAYDPSAYGLYEAGYYQGLADYETTVQCAAAAAAYGGSGASYGSSYSPEIEAAYYQGMADYEAILG